MSLLYFCIFISFYCSCDPYFHVYGPPPTSPLLYDYRKSCSNKVMGFHNNELYAGLSIPLPQLVSTASNNNNTNNKSNSSTSSSSSSTASVAPFPPACILYGDCKFIFYDYDTFGKHDKMFTCWLNTSFVKDNYMKLTKMEVNII